MLGMNDSTQIPAASHNSETTDRKNTMGMAQKRTSTCVNDQPRRADPAADNRLMSELLGLGVQTITVDPGGQNASGPHRGLTTQFQPRWGDWGDSHQCFSPPFPYAHPVPKVACRSDKIEQEALSAFCK